jgi:peptide/nickel transport system permease protein
MGRFGFVAKRLILTVPLLLGVLLCLFLLFTVTPGDPARETVGLRASQQQVAAVREKMHLNDPPLVQYGRYVSDIVHGDLGYSFKSRQPVIDEISQRLPVTIWLIGAGTLVALLISTPLGILAALRRDTPIDHALRLGGLFGLAMPSFWVGLMLILVIALPTGIVPVGGFGTSLPDHLRSIVLPALTLAIALAPIQIRSLRASVASVMESDYITTARSIGVARSRLIRRFVLRNAIASTVTLMAIQIGFLLFDSVVIETTFALPGVGQGLVLAVQQRDLPTIQGYALLFALIVIIVYLAADIITAMLDPRVEIES